MDHALQAPRKLSCSLQYYTFMPQVFLETLRLYPPGPATVREAPEGLTLSGYAIPKGTPITVNKLAIQYIKGRIVYMYPCNQEWLN